MIQQNEIINVIKETNPQLKDYEITINTDLIVDIGMSSLQLLITISEIENKYDIVISIERLKNIYTIRNIIEAISCKE